MNIGFHSLMSLGNPCVTKYCLNKILNEFQQKLLSIFQDIFSSPHNQNDFKWNSYVDSENHGEIPKKSWHSQFSWTVVIQIWKAAQNYTYWFATSTWFLSTAILSGVSPSPFGSFSIERGLNTVSPKPGWNSVNFFFLKSSLTPTQKLFYNGCVTTLRCKVKNRIFSLVYNCSVCPWL